MTYPKGFESQEQKRVYRVADVPNETFSRTRILPKGFEKYKDEITPPKHLTKRDFIERYLDNFSVIMTIHSDRIKFEIKDSWEINHDIVSFALTSTNCTIHSLSYEEITVIIK